MISRTNKKFWQAYDKLDKTVKQQAYAAYRLFCLNPQHPSLHLKCVHGNLPIYSVRINLNYRAVGIMENKEIIWFWIGSHDEYEKLISRF
ncbi:MAG: type II toxin-antitoxin system RelE family toxin [Microcystaceae cyanobacterium]